MTEQKLLRKPCSCNPTLIKVEIGRMGLVVILSQIARTTIAPLLASIVLLLCTSCIKQVKTLPVGPITISGEINDAAGLPLPNSSVKLFRGGDYLRTTTDANGRYAFPNLAASS